jgi:hypothetical protein
VIESPQGLAIVLVNWSGKPVKGLAVTLNAFDEMRPIRPATMKLASGGDYTVMGGARDRVIIDLDVADAIILRKSP